MFTGIVQDLGAVRRINRSGNIYNLELFSETIYRDTKIGESVAVNGVCLTVASRASGLLTFQIMAETARKTGLSKLEPDEKVNLEGSLRLGGTLDGHFVTGHVDCVGDVKMIDRSGDGFAMRIGYPREFDNLVVDRGSVAVDGISLTVGRAGTGVLDVHIIPHTSNHTTLYSKRAGDGVNLEFDILGKYAARQSASGKRREISEEFLKSNGF